MEAECVKCDCVKSVYSRGKWPGMCKLCAEKQYLTDNPDAYARKLEYQNLYRRERRKNDPEYAARIREYDRVQDARQHGREVPGGPRVPAGGPCSDCGAPSVAKGKCERCYSRGLARERRIRFPEAARAASLEVTERARRNLEAIRGAKDAPCADCGRMFPSECMDFDHIAERGVKKFTLNSPGPRCLETVLAEIAKCDLVCACCHRVRTRKRRALTLPENANVPESVRRNLRVIQEAKSAPCTDCSERFPYECMDFDHITERGSKLFNLSNLGGRRLASVLAEIAKCDVVCVNCHRTRTRARAAALGRPGMI